ncbi:hypothetical protein BDD43_4069 [Mucilaginibacter gracilis]|uniref:PepSY-like beta-lactamase-inhibitor n=1 Tax=Mucilaginibacter gracilis TaxID=423350 RepID=A0A495J654_9SPHI|nr:hypothetical protein [Mucilaginibacter gracilis]RKR83854.1 hypothetical protein BDD43_4069 [Mucilaginibacter gracilis]
MKKILVTAILFSSLSIGVFAADGGKKKDASNSEAVSYTVLNQFAYDFKDAKDIVWKVDANCQKADFISNGQKYTAFYSVTGEYMGITRAITITSIPAAAQKEIATQYAGYQVGEVIELQPKATSTSALEPYASSNADETKVFFVDLKNEKEEILVKVNSNSDVYFFKQVK